jgi:hypothetical protein
VTNEEERSESGQNKQSVCFFYVFPLNAVDNSNQSPNQTRCGRNPLVGVETQFKLLNLKTGFEEEAKSGWERR